jgi:hypothetical protein
MRLLLVFLAVGVLACSRKTRAPERVESPRNAADSAEMDATYLGREIYQLLDQASAYRGSHRGRSPRALRDLGVDSLTSDLARAITTGSGGLRASASFRDPAGHQFISCSGELRVLEEAVLGDGRYVLDCTMRDGVTIPVQAGSALE